MLNSSEKIQVFSASDFNVAIFNKLPKKKKKKKKSVNF